MKTSFRIILNTRRHTSIQIHSIHSSSEYKIQLRERERGTWFIYGLNYVYSLICLSLSASVSPSRFLFAFIWMLTFPTATFVNRWETFWFSLKNLKWKFYKILGLFCLNSEVYAAKVIYLINLILFIWKFWTFFNYKIFLIILIENEIVYKLL